jgi:uncharacterized protein DUF3309
MLTAPSQPTPSSSSHSNPREVLEEPLVTILIIILVLMLIGALPAWPHSRNWGYRPSGGLGLVLLILLILFLLGYL